jgi:protein subunit release factor B
MGETDRGPVRRSRAIPEYGHSEAAMFPVTADKQRALEARMAALGVREADLDEHFVRSGGKGGQNVNKVSTCVVLCHVPTGVTVKCQRERSQALNRFLARRELLDKLEARQRGAVQAEAAERARIRRQKRRRSRRAKEKMVAAKRLHAEKKAARRAPSGDD